MDSLLNQTNGDADPRGGRLARNGAPAPGSSQRTPGSPLGRRIPTSQRALVIASLLACPDVAGDDDG